MSVDFNSCQAKFAELFAAVFREVNYVYSAASGHKKSEVEFQLRRCAFLESGCTQVQTWSGPGEANRGPRWALSVLCSAPVLRSTSCLGGEWGVQVLSIRATNPTSGSYRQALIDACSL